MSLRWLSRVWAGSTSIVRTLILEEKWIKWRHWRNPRPTRKWIWWILNQVSVFNCHWQYCNNVWTVEINSCLKIQYSVCPQPSLRQRTASKNFFSSRIDWLFVLLATNMHADTRVHRWKGQKEQLRQGKGRMTSFQWPDSIGFLSYVPASLSLSTVGFFFFLEK